jgi:hypothetical protein
MEFVIAFPPWLLLILGIMQFSMVAIARLVVLYAAHAGARAAIVAGSDPAKMQAAAENAARQVCALVLQVETSSAKRRSIPGWGDLPGSGSVDDLVTVPVLVSVGGFLPEPAPETPALPAFPTLVTASMFPWSMNVASKPQRIYCFNSSPSTPTVNPPAPPPPKVKHGDGTAIYIEDKLASSPPEIWNEEDALVHVRVEMEFPLIIPVIDVLVGHRLNQQRLYWNPFADDGIWGNRSGGSQGGRISGSDAGDGSYYISLTADVQMVSPFRLADKEEE